MTTNDHAHPPGKRETTELLASALASGSSYRDAAEIAGCSLSTVRRRMTEPAFRHRVEQARAEHVQRVTAQLGALSGIAVERLGTLLDDDNPNVRLSAARAVLSESRAHREADLEQRLSALENALRDVA